eukprot:TRINITY_DN7417_c0_g1_i1.p1 TRINITY_DN7417_c0_g1~~TRINITY_DN7417_c0_g1_i1.p1  ORF type:complete len:323 (-),score=72.51 TRINITY_DN7417_c0_g1_i1:104-1072(-)
MSRQSYRVTCSAPDIRPHEIVLRSLAKHGMTSSEKEAIAFKAMSDARLGPSLLASNGEWRAEEYIPSRVMKCTEINQEPYRRNLAIKLGLLHGLPCPHPKDNDGYIYRAMNSYLEQCRRANTITDKWTQDQKKMIEETDAVFSTEEQEFVSKIIAPFPLVTSHNDVWVGNILIKNDSSDVVFLDYEVIDYNFAGYDIGKLMLEVLYERDPKKPMYNFLPFDLLPSDDDIRAFIRYYLAARDGSITIDSDDAQIEEAATRIQSASIETLLKEVKIGIMVAGYYSALLGQACAVGLPPSDFDFVKFAHDGGRAYFYIKKQLYHQ